MTKKSSQDIKKLNIQQFNNGKGIVRTEIPEADYIKEYFGDDIYPSQLVLDCACGTGAVLMSLDCKRIGLDISMLNIKDKKYLKNRINFVAGDAENLPFKNKSIDAVILAAALHHFPNYEKNIKEVGRILKNGAKVYILEANSIGLLPVAIPLWPLNVIRKIRGTYPEYEIHAGRISIIKVIRLLKANHFTIHKIFRENTFVGVYTELLIKHIPGFKRLKWIILFFRRINQILTKCLPVIFISYYRLSAIKNEILPNSNS
ncbi:MAG: methyltransferase domain-containing protein [Planctomycetota bacterium]